MPTLILLRHPSGTALNQAMELTLDQVVIGRDLLCQLVLPDRAVSRQHAMLTREDGNFFIEDLKSRNRTFLNDHPLESRTQLKNQDRIKICGYVMQYRDDGAKLTPDDLTRYEPDLFGPESENLQASGRLKALLDISLSLAITRNLETLLPLVTDALFGLFKQADRCLILVMESGKPLAVIQKNRAGVDVQIHAPMLQKAIDTRQSFLSEASTSDGSHDSLAVTADFEIRSIMSVPMSASDGKGLGAIQLDTCDRANRFSADDLNLLTIVANLAGTAVERAILHESLLAREVPKDDSGSTE